MGSPPDDIIDEQERYIAGLEKAQLAIIESESRYRRLFENSQIPIWCDDFYDVIKELETLRAQGIELHSYLEEDPQRTFGIARKLKVIDVNNAAFKLFKAKSVKQFNLLLIKSFEHGAIATFAKALCAIWDGRESFESDIQFLTSEGDIIDAIVTFRIPKIADHFANVPISIIDITERLRLQQENLRKSQLAMLGEYSAKFAHEINNPLSGIINYAQVLKDKTESEGPESDLLNRIIDEGSRITTLVKGMLSFSRDSGDRKTCQDLEPIITNALMFTNHLAEKNNINVVADLSSGLPKINCNPQQLQQVILNIVINACQAISGGLPAGETEGLIQLTADSVISNDQEFVLLQIENNGPNIPEEIMSDIKKPFFTTKDTENGTGLGLSISNEIIQDHGGELIIESSAGEPTKMIIKLPV